MADWKKLLKKVLLVDGVIDASEIKVLRKEICADGVVDTDEIRFLVELRDASKEVTPAFSKFFFTALKLNVLRDGVVDAAETRKLRAILFADGVIDADEKRFLKDIKRSAKSVAPAFEKLLAECSSAP